MSELELMRWAKNLLAAGVDEDRVLQVLEVLDRNNDPSASLTEVRARLVVARDARGAFEPSSGQGVLELGGDPPETSTQQERTGGKVVAFRVPPSGDHEEKAREGDRASGAERSACARASRDWYASGCELELAGGEDCVREAIECYRRAIAGEPEHLDAHLNLGRCLHEQGDLEGAERHYRDAVHLAPEDATAWFNLGVALEDRCQPVEALAAYDRASSIAPTLVDAHYNAARLHEQLGDKAEAVRRLKLYRQLLSR